MDLNADLGEGFGVWRLGDDDALLDVITSANVACGFHAGDPSTMRRVCARRGRARRRGRRAGRLPGPGRLRAPAHRLRRRRTARRRDLPARGAGRRSAGSPAPGSGTSNRTAPSTTPPRSTPAQAAAVVAAVLDYDGSLPVLCQPGSVLPRLAARRGPDRGRRGLRRPGLPARRHAGAALGRPGRCCTTRTRWSPGPCGWPARARSSPSTGPSCRATSRRSACTATRRARSSWPVRSEPPSARSALRGLTAARRPCRRRAAVRCRGRAGSAEAASGRPRSPATGTPQSCRVRWQAACSTSTSHVAACATTWSTPFGTAALSTSRRDRSVPTPAPSTSNSGGDADTSSRVDGPYVRVQLLPRRGCEHHVQGHLAGRQRRTAGAPPGAGRRSTSPRPRPARPAPAGSTGAPPTPPRPRRRPRSPRCRSARPGRSPPWTPCRSTGRSGVPRRCRCPRPAPSRPAGPPRRAGAAAAPPAAGPSTCPKSNSPWPTAVCSTPSSIHRRAEVSLSAIHNRSPAADNPEGWASHTSGSGPSRSASTVVPAYTPVVRFDRVEPPQLVDPRHGDDRPCRRTRPRPRARRGRRPARRARGRPPRDATAGRCRPR